MMKTRKSPQGKRRKTRNSLSLPNLQRKTITHPDIFLRVTRHNPQKNIQILRRQSGVSYQNKKHRDTLSLGLLQHRTTPTLRIHLFSRMKREQKTERRMGSRSRKDPRFPRQRMASRRILRERHSLQGTARLVDKSHSQTDQKRTRNGGRTSRIYSILRQISRLERRI